MMTPDQLEILNDMMCLKGTWDIGNETQAAIRAALATIEEQENELELLRSAANDLLAKCDTMAAITAREWKAKYGAKP